MTDLDDATIEALAERHVPALRAFVRLRMGDALSARESSADVVQSVFRELLTERERFEFQGDAAFKAWLFTAAVRKILQRSRYHGAQVRTAERETPLEDADALLGCYASCASPSQAASAREQVEQFERAFHRLSDADREIITLTKIAGIPHAEVGKRLGCTEQNSRTLLRRALIRLSELL